jgi:hypothetical protein
VLNRLRRRAVQLVLSRDILRIWEICRWRRRPFKYVASIVGLYQWVNRTPARDALAAAGCEPYREE